MGTVAQELKNLKKLPLANLALARWVVSTKDSPDHPLMRVINVEQQVFVNFVQGDFTIGIGSAQFKAQRRKAVQALPLNRRRDMQLSPLPN